MEIILLGIYFDETFLVGIRLKRIHLVKSRSLLLRLVWWRLLFLKPSLWRSFFRRLLSWKLEILCGDRSCWQCGDHYFGNTFWGDLSCGKCFGDNICGDKPLENRSYRVLLWKWFFLRPLLWRLLAWKLEKFCEIVHFDIKLVETIIVEIIILWRLSCWQSFGEKYLLR